MKIIYPVLVILTSIVVFSEGCGENKKEVKSPPPLHFIPGKWRVNSIYTAALDSIKKKSRDEYNLIMKEMVDSSYMEFEKDSIFVERFGPDITGGHWKISDDMRFILATYLAGETHSIQIMKLSSDSLTLKDISVKNPVTIELSRWKN